ncbi:hypothetical protein KS08_07710 [Bacillus subtilis]|nr:hypothetical protein KS08_07710 [Bacillus subtilis]
MKRITGKQCEYDNYVCRLNETGGEKSNA